MALYYDDINIDDLFPETQYLIETIGIANDAAEASWINKQVDCEHDTLFHENPDLRSKESAPSQFREGCEASDIDIYEHFVDLDLPSEASRTFPQQLEVAHAPTGTTSSPALQEDPFLHEEPSLYWDPFLSNTFSITSDTFDKDIPSPAPSSHTPRPLPSFAAAPTSPNECNSAITKSKLAPDNAKFDAFDFASDLVHKLITSHRPTAPDNFKIDVIGILLKGFASTERRRRNGPATAISMATELNKERQYVILSECQAFILQSVLDHTEYNNTEDSKTKGWISAGLIERESEKEIRYHDMFNEEPWTSATFKLCSKGIIEKSSFLEGNKHVDCYRICPDVKEPKLVWDKDNYITTRSPSNPPNTSTPRNQSSSNVGPKQSDKDTTGSNSPTRRLKSPRGSKLHPKVYTFQNMNKKTYKELIEHYIIEQFHGINDEYMFGNHIEKYVKTFKGDNFKTKSFVAALNSMEKEGIVERRDRLRGLMGEYQLYIDEL